MLTVGLTSDGGTSRVISANYKFAAKFTVGGSALNNVDRGRVLFASSTAKRTCKARMVVYADNAGSPGSLIAQSNEVVNPGLVGVAEWITFTFPTPFSLTASQVVWIGYIIDTSSIYVRVTSSGGTARENADTYADGAASAFGTASSSSNELSAYLIATTEVQASKGVGLAVLSPPSTSVSISKGVAHVVLSTETKLAVSKALGYAVLASPPPLTVTGLTPPAEVVGTPLTITGTGFEAGATVDFGGVLATDVVVNSGTEIACTAPPHALGSVDVTVTVGGYFATLAAGFTYLDPYRIDSATPSSIHKSGSVPVALVGDGFGEVVGVTVGGTSASFVTADDEHMTVDAPAGAVGATTIVVRDGAGVTRSIAFSYVEASLSAPVVPASGRVGDTITVHGAGLLAAAKVIVGGAYAVTTWISPTELRAVVPTLAPAVYDVDVENTGPGYVEILTLASAFEVLTPIGATSSGPVVLYVVS